ncbi:Tannase [Dactylellina cionopaga]|nr:Tannase [Dactylellina cionopaga]
MDAQNYLANKPDLSRLQSSGHKLLVYHGLEDDIVTAEASYLYYDAVAKNMSLPSSQLDGFYRFFHLPGANHCYSGRGAWYVGGPDQVGSYPETTSISFEEGVLMKMVKWVEDGVEPETLRAYKIGESGLEGAKDHCRYPFQSNYKGAGLDPNLSTSWECV